MTAELDRLLAGADALGAATAWPVVLIGGTARAVWASARATQDVDVLIGTDDLEAVAEAGSSIGMVAVPAEVHQLRSSGMTRLRLPEALAGDVRLDIIGASHPYYERVIARSQPLPGFGCLRVACAEDIILLKVLASRPVDRADVAAIARAQIGKLDYELIRSEAATLELELPPELNPPGG